MKNPRLASRYAKSLLDLAIEKNSLDATLQDIKTIQAAAGNSRELTLIYRNPVVPADKKVSIFHALFNDKISEDTLSFLELLVRKNREANIADIIDAFIEQYNALKNIKTVKLTTAAPIDEGTRNAIIQKLAAGMAGYQVEVKTHVDPEIIGGFVLETNDKLIDASIRYDLNAVKKQFSKNIYVKDIR